MVHRAPDSRLLTSLSTHEQAYHKHLLQLVDAYAQSALNALAAYASATPSSTARGIMGVAGSLAGADEALRRYAYAVDEWRQKLESIRQAEEDVGRVVRDRDILVTRLIKLSKSQKPTRDSFIATISPAYQLDASASTSSLGSPAPSLISANTKLSAAQAELQACETALVAKEAALDRLRIQAVREGLERRCKAMVECGWAWGEMGKEGLRALEELDKDRGTPEKPLPTLNGHAPGSDLSSLGPSQSASQIFSPGAENSSSRPTSPSPQLYILPAHQISEFAHPPMERRITEETSQDLHAAESESEGETDERPVQMVENKPFERDKKPAVSVSTDRRADESPQRKRFGFRPQHTRTYSGSTVSVAQSSPVNDERDRGRKPSFFGRLFRGSSSNVSSAGYGDGKTRTNDNSRRKGRGDDSDSETEGNRRWPVFNRRRGSEDSYAGGAPPKANPRPGLGAAHPALGGGAVDVTASTKGGRDGTPPGKAKLKKHRTTLVGEEPGAAGWMSDGAAAGVGARAKRASVKGRGAPPTLSEPQRTGSVRSTTVAPSNRTPGGNSVTVVRSASSVSKSVTGNGNLARPPSTGNLARSSSTASKATNASMPQATSAATSIKSGRRASGTATWSGSATGPYPGTASLSQHAPADAGRGESLLAIVEGAARERRASLSAAQNGGMFLPTAPKARDRTEIVAPVPKPAPASTASAKATPAPAKPALTKAQTVGAAVGGSSLYLPSAPKPQGPVQGRSSAPNLQTQQPAASESALYLPSAAAYTSSSTTKAASSSDGMFLPSAGSYTSDRAPPTRAATISGPAPPRPVRSSSREPDNRASGNGTKSDGLMPAHLAAIHTPAHRAIAAAVPLKSALRTRTPSPMPPVATSAPMPAPALFMPSAPGPIVLPPSPPPIVASPQPIVASPPPIVSSPPPAVFSPSPVVASSLPIVAPYLAKSASPSSTAAVLSTARPASAHPYDPTRRRSLADSDAASMNSFETAESFKSTSDGEGTVDGGGSTGTIEATPPAASPVALPAAPLKPAAEPALPEPVIIAPTPRTGSTTTLQQLQETAAAATAIVDAGNDEHLAVPGHVQGGSDVSNGSASSNGTIQLDSEGQPVLNSDGRPVRRKSVRLSMKPTFSPTPPALEYDDLDDYWSKEQPGEPQKDQEESDEKASTEGSAEDKWRDSSDEDEAYMRARQALRKLKRRW